MHIPDGILPAKVCLVGYGITGLCTWYSLSQIERQGNAAAGIPRASLLAAAFFLASSIQIPIPPTSVHLVLNGVLGAVLGYYAFPAILIGLFFQAVVFGHGGLSTLGINTAMMGIPALFAYHLFRLRDALGSYQWITKVLSFLAGALGLGLTAAIFFSLVILTLPSGFDNAMERNALVALMVAHGPLMLIEGTFSLFLILFLERVKPDLLQPR